MSERIYRMPKPGEFYKCDVGGDLMLMAKDNQCVKVYNGCIGGLFAPDGTRYICNADGTPKTRGPKPVPEELLLEPSGGCIKVMGLFTDSELRQLADGINDYLTAVEKWETEGA